MRPCWRSTSSWNNSSFNPSSSMEDAERLAGAGFADSSVAGATSAGSVNSASPLRGPTVARANFTADCGREAGGIAAAGGVFFGGGFSASTFLSPASCCVPTSSVTVGFAPFLQNSFAGDFEGQSLIRFSVRGYFYFSIGLVGIVHRGKIRAVRGGEVDGLGQDGNEVFERVNAFGIDVGAAGVGHLIGNFELGGAGAQREGEGVTVLLAFFHRIGLESVTAFGGGKSLDDLRAFGDVELEIALVHLRTQRRGFIFAGEDGDES